MLCPQDEKIRPEKGPVKSTAERVEFSKNHHFLFKNRQINCQSSSAPIVLQTAVRPETAAHKGFVSSHLTKENFYRMFNVILYQPEIPPNTGNIIRLCANAGARLHLVGPLGFTLDDARLKRAGLDYRELADVKRYLSWEDWRARHAGMPLWAFSTRGANAHDRARFQSGDGLLFGPESRGLPAGLLDTFDASRVLRLPMLENSRSMNLSNAVAVGLYEGLRQLGFPGMG